MKKEINELVKILDANKLTRVSFENSDKKLGTKTKITIERNQTIANPNYSQPQVISNETTTETKDEIHGTQVKAPIVATFYESPGIGKKPFVKLNDKVKKGQTLFILEAMKVMNEIKSPINGVVLAINVKNEQLVEYGQTIMVIG